MGKVTYNKDWICYRTDNPQGVLNINIPHDAMLLDEKTSQSVSGINNGWYEAKDYTYEKKIYVPEAHHGKDIFIEFEGIYKNPIVYLNDEKIAEESYGYLGFYIKLTEKMKYGEINRLRIEVKNSDQPNSRWYSGTGIYRPVWLHVIPKEHIQFEGIKITPVDYINPTVKVEVRTNGSGLIRIEILEQGKILQSVSGETEGRFEQKIEIENAKLWSVEEPYLYVCRVTYGDDVREETFGIRVIEWNPEKGFCINGKRVILRGACIHHDNGILGACAYDFAEERKIRILKENGYNAIRSAHNPCSKALLDACDRLGMLVMDEYVDVWYIHKTKYDYALEVENNYRTDLKRLVDKDYNHPSVILYSTGNEVAETAQKRGISLCKELTEYLHELDATRPVTCGVNIFFNFLSSMGFGVYSDKKAEREVENVKKKKAVGSEFYNNLAGLFGSDFMKMGATLYPCDVKTREAFEKMDIAGYNYGILRYQHDLKKYPNRLILGTETFCSDAYQFWEVAKSNNRIIGDFVWAGMDYLGEVGVGAWEYKEYAPRFDKGLGWASAGSGRIDLTGKALAEMKYTRVAFELDKIGIAVVPVNHTGEKHSSSAWKMSNAIESWSWNGFDGKKAYVEVYARAHHVSLFLNGKCVGTKPMKRDCKCMFKTIYHGGELKAIAYNENNEEIAETIMKTAGEKTVLTMEPEQRTVRRDNELCYIRLKFTDEQGVLKPYLRGDIKVNVEGGVLLALGSACPYYPDSYLSDVTDTYYGEALAIIKPNDCDQIIVFAECSLYDEMNNLMNLSSKTEIKVE